MGSAHSNGASPSDSTNSSSAPSVSLAAPEGTASSGASPAQSASAAPVSSALVPSSARRTYVVAAVGDSLTDYGSPLGGGYLRVLERECPKSRFDNYGKGAAMVNQMRKRFRDQVLGPDAARYTHVIVFGGINDLYSDLTAHRTNEKISSDLRQMYDWSHEAGAKVVAVGVAPWGGFSKYWNERREANTVALNAWMLGEVGAAVDHFVDAKQLLACGTKLCPEYEKPFRDGIHFGKAGHAVLGAALKAQVFPDCL
jgi:lysophospholipase L1-like esterase